MLFSIYVFNLDSHYNNYIFIMLLKIIVYLSIYIYYVSYPIIYKIKILLHRIRHVSMYRIPTS